MLLSVCVHEMHIYYMPKITTLWFKCDWHGSPEIRVNVPTATLILSVCTRRAVTAFRSRILHIAGLGREANDPCPQLYLQEKNKGYKPCSFPHMWIQTMSPCPVLCNQGMKESAVMPALKGTVSVAVGT